MSATIKSPHSLFDLPSARRSDPTTSHAAAEKMGHKDVNTSRIYAKVLETASSTQAEAMQKKPNSLADEREFK